MHDARVATIERTPQDLGGAVQTWAQEWQPLYRPISLVCEDTIGYKDCWLQGPHVICYKGLQSFALSAPLAIMIGGNT
jgi:hypothetical protein